MGEKLVSVVIPCYSKQRQYLDRAVASVKNQTYGNIEIIVIDDDNINATKARNIGINKANGEYIAFLDADDEWLPTKIEKQVKCLLDNPACFMVICYSLDYRFGQVRITKPKKILFHKDLIKSFNLSSTSSYLVRKYPLDLLGGFDETLQSGHEYDLALRLFCLKHTEHHHIRTVPEVLMIQHASDNQISENWGKKIRGIMQLAKKHRQYYSLKEYMKTTCVLVLFLFGYIFGNKIYRIIIPIKKMYEGEKDETGS